MPLVGKEEPQSVQILPLAALAAYPPAQQVLTIGVAQEEDGLLRPAILLQAMVIMFLRGLAWRRPTRSEDVTLSSGAP